MEECCRNNETKEVMITSEDKEKLCPKCGQEGQKVENITVKSLVVDGLDDQVGKEDYFLCTNPNCEIVYYNNDTGKKFLKENVKVRVWFKETEDPIPVCYCAGVTEKQIREEILVKKRAKNLKDIQQYTGAMTGGRCKYTNPTGKCCGGAVNGVIKKALEELKKL